MLLGKTIDWVENGHVPDVITRLGIRRLVKSRAQEEARRYRNPAALAQFIETMNASPLALNTADANAQHYEIPTEFYSLVLGPRLKYSCSLFDSPTTTLDEAEVAMLELSLERARIVDGMSVLELGCGWGSLTLLMAQRLPTSTIVAVSNSASQKAWVDAEAQRRGLVNVEVITADMNDFEADRTFDRVVSIEMFEHMRNHRLLLERIDRWLAPGGKLFFHMFCHRSFPYFFESRSDGDWMARNFFTGGLMPSFDLPLRIESVLSLENRWAVPGTHYARTCRARLNRCDENREAVMAALATGDDPTPAATQYYRWRMFFMACEELFAFDGGNEWHVGHYLFDKL